MGAVDTLYYHEYKLKLATKVSSYKELRLHSIRDFIYAFTFLALAWSEWHGWFVILMVMFICTETVITLLDFVEESLTRITPPVERSMHALMGIVFGIFLGQFFPELLKWWSLPTNIQFVNYGYLSWILSLMALGVFLSGVRDFGSSVSKKEWPQIWSKA